MLETLEVAADRSLLWGLSRLQLASLLLGIFWMFLGRWQKTNAASYGHHCDAEHLMQASDVAQMDENMENTNRTWNMKHVLDCFAKILLASDTLPILIVLGTVFAL